MELLLFRQVPASEQELTRLIDPHHLNVQCGGCARCRRAAA
jgi:hypothetical protein